MTQLMTLEQIVTQFPNQWVLIGNPELKNPSINGTIMQRLIQGIVLLASKDKRELAYQSKDIVHNYEETACVYTGEVAQNRIFLL